MARKVLEKKSSIESSNGKLYLTIEFNSGMHAFLKNTTIKVDGNQVNYIQDGAKYKFEIGSIGSNIDVNTTVSMMGMAVDFKMSLLENTLPEGSQNSAPVIRATDLNLFVGDNFDALTNVVATDEQDGDITSKISAEGSVDTSKAGSYTVTYSVTDSSGETTTKSITVTVSEIPVVENQAPIITAGDISLTVGDTFEPLKNITASDNEDGDISSNVFVKSNNVDTSKEGTYNVTYTVGDSQGKVAEKTITVTVNKKIEKVNDGKYTVSNSVEFVGSGSAGLGNEMARKVLSDKSGVEIKDGKAKFTLVFTEDQYEFLTDFRVSVDGKNVDVNVNKSNRTVVFEAPSIDSEVLVTVKVTVMGRDVSFKVKFNKNTLVQDENGSSLDLGNDTTTPGSGSTDSTNNKTTNSTVTSNVKKGKLYTIKNTVSHSSQTGKEMARKYLSSTSKVEQIDGKNYVTFTFSGSGFMKNHIIYVNGSKVSHQVVSKSGDNVSIRFEVPSLSANIKVALHVIPMSRDIEFSVTLLEDTLTFVKDYEVSSEDGSSLPQTGQAIDATTMVAAGSLLMTTGSVLGRKKRR